MKRSLILLALAVLPAVASTGESFTSGERRVSLVELYTSEGCSSCPPAERWLNGLETQDGLWSEFVPIAFHVDYWDYIGWRDPFAKAEFSERQRSIVDSGAARAVYTPGVFVAGDEWLKWRRSVVPTRSTETPGTLIVRIDNGRAIVRFRSATTLVSPRVHVALLAFDQISSVNAGENRGRRLVHQFVANSVEERALVHGSDGYTAVVELPAATGVQRRALASWVSAGGNPRPIQATGGFLSDD